jgi:hypothetical protein
MGSGDAHVRELAALAAAGLRMGIKPEKTGKPRRHNQLLFWVASEAFLKARTV